MNRLIDDLKEAIESAGLDELRKKELLRMLDEAAEKFDGDLSRWANERYEETVTGINEKGAKFEKLFGGGE